MPLKTEFKVGLFLIISTLLIAVSIGYVAYRKGVFAKTHTFTLSAKSGEDLTEGMPVYFSGINIGTVKALEISDEGSVLIKITIPENHVKWIRTDSTFIVNKPLPLMGSARIVVVTENLKSPILSPQQIREVVNKSDIRDIMKEVQPLLEKVNNIASNVEKMTANIVDPRGSIHKILTNTEAVTGNLAQKKSLLEMAISDKESIDAVHETMKQTKNVMGQVNGILKQVDALPRQVEGTLKEVDAIPRQVEGILKQVEAIPGQVEGILKQVEALARQVEGILKKADETTGRTSDMVGKTDEMVYGKDGILSGLTKTIKDVLAKLEKLNTTIDNINKISSEVADSTTDLKALRSDLDDTIRSVGDTARELEKKIPFKEAPEIKLP